jgi:mycothiol synthase
MADPAIRMANERDLPALHGLLQRCLTLDAFSPELIAEKLFGAPHPGFSNQTLLAEERGDLLGMMQSVVRPAARKAWLGLFAVEPARRRQGVATMLFEQARQGWPTDTAEAEALAIPGNYFTPGLDPRYTEGLCFLERLGFERFKDCVNLTADLSQRFDSRAEQERLASLGIEVRRARPDDGPLLDAYFAQHFGANWRLEAGLALQNDAPSLHLALKTGRVIAFSAHSTQNREWGFFGPMGTAPEARGLGVGRVLLWHCLNDMRDAGHKTSVIPWVGPIAFYRQWCGARVERVFWRYRLRTGRQPGIRASDSCRRGLRSRHR